MTGPRSSIITSKIERAMNKQRRKWLEDVIAKIEEAQSEVQNIAEEERENYDNMPEGLQEGERGQTISENADDLEGVDIDFDSILDTLNEILER